jgi:hypothetical protein
MSEERDQETSAGRSVSGGNSEGANPGPKPGDVSKEQESGAGKPLTAAEQMALYEEKLKEDDWGHQPC